MFSLPQGASQDMQQALMSKPAQPRGMAPQPFGSTNPGNSGMAPKGPGGFAGDLQASPDLGQGPQGPMGIAQQMPAAGEAQMMRPQPLGPGAMGGLVGQAQGPPPQAMQQPQIGGMGAQGAMGGQPNPLMMMALQRALQQKSAPQPQPQPSPMLGAGAQMQ